MWFGTILAEFFEKVSFWKVERCLTPEQKRAEPDPPTKRVRYNEAANDSSLPAQRVASCTAQEVTHSHVYGVCVTEDLAAECKLSDLFYQV